MVYMTKFVCLHRLTEESGVVLNCKTMQPGSSIITSQAQQPQPVGAINFMNSDLFKAAEDGNLEAFNKYQAGDLHCLVDGRGNTALHIYSRTGGYKQVKTNTRFPCFRPAWEYNGMVSINFVKHLVDKCPSVLLQPNVKGEIPLHIALQNGNHEIVKFFIERAKVMSLPQPHEDLENGTSSSEATGSWVWKMLTMKDNKGNTAFHKAAGSGDVKMVQLVVEELDPHDFSSFSANDMGEPPLYLAVKNTWDSKAVVEILEHCKPVNYGGPNGTTALHAAVIHSGNIEIMGKLIEARKEITKETDAKGRTPLHHAVYLGGWAVETVKVLLEADASAAYIKDKERGMTALHMAALEGDTDVMEAIISSCPGCCEIVDDNGWNFLHIAVAILPTGKLKGFLDAIRHKINDSTITNLLNETDANGITPFHVSIAGPVAKDYTVFQEFLYLRPLDFDYDDSETKKNKIQQVLKDLDKTEVVRRPVYYYLGMQRKKEERPVKHLLRHMKKKEEEDKVISEHKILEKGRETRLLVATLVATITFAAALAVPGGYKEKDKGKEGTAMLSGDEAFKAFIVTDTVAFVSSLLAIFVHFLYPSLMKRDPHLLVRWLRLADWLTFLAMVAMVVAFSTGTYAVLKSSKEFAIVTCALGLVFFPGLLKASFFIFKHSVREFLE